MKRILGLDLGTNSIGWALIEQNFEEKQGKILGLGSRIIPMDQGSLGEFERGNSISQTAERTGFRGVRRLRERHLLRRERLHSVLNILGFLPKHYAECLDFEKHFGQFINDSEPKLVYRFNDETGKTEFLFQKSFDEMLSEFSKEQPLLVANGKKVPYDWTIFYLRKKALNHRIEREELAWLLLNFNQKRGYYQLRGEEEEEAPNKLVEFHSLLVTKVEDSGDRKNKDEIWYNVFLENGWIYRRTSKIPLDWVGKTKEFIVTTDLNEDGSIKTDKDGKEKRSFRAPQADDWTLIKKKTEFEIEQSNKTVGCYIYETLLNTPGQKIKGKLVRTIERKFYRDELRQILAKQKSFHPELQDKSLYLACIEELYKTNENHRSTISEKDFTHLFINDIIFYQRPLKSKKSLISDCRYESRSYLDKEGQIAKVPVKCIAKSHPLFQEFRLWQFLANLRIFQKTKEVGGKLLSDVDVTEDFLKTEADWVHLFDWMNDRKEIDQKAFLKYPAFGLKRSAELFRWNYVEDKVYPANETRAQILFRLSKLSVVPEGFLTNESEEELWHILYSIQDKAEIEKALATFANKHELGSDFSEHFRKFTPFKQDYGSYSAKAIKKLLPLMRRGKYWNPDEISTESRQRINAITERLKSIGYDHKKIAEVIDDEIPKQVLKSFIDCADPFKGLSTYQACYVVYGRHSEEGEVVRWLKPSDIEKFLQNTFKQHYLRNPIVEKVISESLRVVADIWNYYGQGEMNFFDEIHIELGREMKNPADKRKWMTATISENENTNLRIKALLTEMFNDRSIENVRPNSPGQQEILKLYEEGALLSALEIPDDVLRISRTGQPSQAELVRYKLWLEQKYRSPYTGEIIPLAKLFTPAYEIEHIIPQSRFFDDSFSNKVICEAEVNKDKDNKTAYEYICDESGKIIELNFGKTVKLFSIEAYEDFIKNNYSGNKGKMKRLLMDDIPDSFINRQLNDTRYISKFVKNLLSNIVREEGELETTSKNLASSNGSITTMLKTDWGLHEIWSELVQPRFERLNELTKSKDFGDWINKEGKRVFQTRMPFELQKGFNKKRIDHRHHAMDALVIACATRNHINYLNNEYAKSEKRYDLRASLCYKNKAGDNENYKWTFTKPWETFTRDAKEKLSGTIVSFKQNIRVINKSTNWYQKLQHDEKGTLKKIFVKQSKGDNWAIRKPLHKDTVAGLVELRFKKTVSLSTALDQWEMIADKPLRNKIRELVKNGADKKQILKYFKSNDNKLNGTDISKVTLYFIDRSNVASRVKIDENFNSATIQNITDSGIQKILTDHLVKYNERKEGKVIEHPELAFSADGIDELNKNIVSLNNGKQHQPVYTVRKFEPLGNKFSVGSKGNKKSKFVEAAKGTNLFFAIYLDENGKRNYESVPLNIVIERQKQGLASVPDENEKGSRILFDLSPNNLVFVPTQEESENILGVDFSNLSSEQVKRIYKMVSSTGTTCFFSRNDIAVPIWNKNEFSQLNKMEKTIDGVMIKEVCWKLKVSRLGRIIEVIK